MPTEYDQDLRTIMALNIIDYMTARGMSQADVCEKTGIKQSTLSGYMRAVRYPRQEQLKALAKCFGVSVADLTGSEDGPDEYVNGWPDINEVVEKMMEMGLADRKKILSYVRFVHQQSRNQD